MPSEASTPNFSCVEEAEDWGPDRPQRTELKNVLACAQHARKLADRHGDAVLGIPADLGQAPRDGAPAQAARGGLGAARFLGDELLDHAVERTALRALPHEAGGDASALLADVTGVGFGFGHEDIILCAIKPYAILREMSAATFFEKRGKFFWISAGVVLVIALGMVDYVTGTELNIALFYLIPIIMMIWYMDGQMGLLFAFASTVVGFIANYSAG